MGEETSWQIYQERFATMHGFKIIWMLERLGEKGKVWGNFNSELEAAEFLVRLLNGATNE